MVFKKVKTRWRKAFLAAGPAAWGGSCVTNSDVATIQGIECLVANIIKIVSPIAGLAFGIMFLVGGFKLIFSGGNPKEVQSAQNVLTFAVIGLVLTIISYLVLILIENFTGVKVTEFTIPKPQP